VQASCFETDKEIKQWHDMIGKATDKKVAMKEIKEMLAALTNEKEIKL